MPGTDDVSRSVEDVAMEGIEALIAAAKKNIDAMETEYMMGPEHITCVLANMIGLGDMLASWADTFARRTAAIDNEWYERSVRESHHIWASIQAEKIMNMSPEEGIAALSELLERTTGTHQHPDNNKSRTANRMVRDAPQAGYL